ncbi:MAG: hypothetical protein KKE20_04305, partial [Nanoarchaeota archaeon]|nr:hypothetical protein [Nanoarchaeota archaeon]
MGRRKMRKTAMIMGLMVMLAYALSQLYSGITGAVVIDSVFQEDDSDNIDIIPKELGKEPFALFCPRENCAHNLVYLINHSSKVHCAFFDLDVPEIIDALERQNASVVVDADNYKMVEGKLTNLKKDTRTAFMHNKFCILDDEVVWTGSFNPTVNGDTKNNNNVIVISSEYLAENYEAEFKELWNGEFGKGEAVKNPVVEVSGIRIENYFCPEDWCANKVLKALSYANESIYFMTFSFTHEQIGDLLVKRHSEGIEVKGLFEKSQNSQYSQARKLNESGIEVMLDTNPAAMHHKVFIIDKKIVVTGSFNPTKNGDTKNDENIMIIYDEK